MSIKVQCAHGHFIGVVDVTDTGIIPLGTRHGLTWDYAPDQNLTRIHARCFKRDCTRDYSRDFTALHADLKRAVDRGETTYRLPSH